MSTFVLVHGSWHDGSAWQAVVDHLEAKDQALCSHDRRTLVSVKKNVNHAQCTHDRRLHFWQRLNRYCSLRT